MKTVTWVTNDKYIIGHTTPTMPDYANQKIAAFDLDDTLVKPKANKKFSQTELDYNFIDPSIPKKLQDLANNNYQLVIVTNQKGITTNKTDPTMWKNKLNNIINELKLDFTILCCIVDDYHRKPNTGLWDIYIKGYNQQESFYCGDAGGLPQRTINNIKIPKDFADTDYKFALNLNIKFQHRDEFAFNTPPPKCNISYIQNIGQYCKPQSYIFQHSQNQEIVLLCGFPASGKSHFANAISNNQYIRVNMDTLKTQPKCIKLTEESIKDNKSVIIDNTNISATNRKLYIDIAKKYNIAIRCITFTCPIDLCKHNSHYRNFITKGEIDVIPNIAYNMLKKKYMQPNVNEGFNNIDEVDFCFDDNTNKDNYCKYYY